MYNSRRKVRELATRVPRDTVTAGHGVLTCYKKCEQLGGVAFQKAQFNTESANKLPLSLRPMSGSCADKILSNPDLAGIGTRINFYVTIVLTALIPENEHTTELVDGLYENSVFYGLGLVITAVIQTLQNQLDLYHAIFVMQIIFSLDFVYAYGTFCVHSSTPLKR
ncbi:hypothetical protein B0F90DRAFT_1023215 [Multifurca ochricompacta]|uniref:Uncharacterized protein n=1 Tax=Multifurca ochricompacta TaxID=376703 RepID=A0AAD4M174_9AGAM|nr:hypothetical protein B0F90DRAFT_1023215 [Multifurca ochricompacta]